MFLNVLIGLVIVFGSIVLDQVTKICAVASLSDVPGQTVEVINGFFRFQLTFNDGAAFSIFKGDFGLLMAMTVLATLIFCYMARYAKFKTAPWFSTGVYLMIGGMLGNFIDRTVYSDHAVVDFLSFTFFGKYNFAIFNVADCCLVIGVICVMIDLIFFESKRSKVGKNNA